MACFMLLRVMDIDEYLVDNLVVEGAGQTQKGAWNAHEVKNMEERAKEVLYEQFSERVRSCISTECGTQI